MASPCPCSPAVSSGQALSTGYAPQHASLCVSGGSHGSSAPGACRAHGSSSPERGSSGCACQCRHRPVPSHHSSPGSCSSSGRPRDPGACRKLGCRCPCSSQGRRGRCRCCGRSSACRSRRSSRHRRRGCRGCSYGSSSRSRSQYSSTSRAACKAKHPQLGRHHEECG